MQKFKNILLILPLMALTLFSCSAQKTTTTQVVKKEAIKETAAETAAREAAKSIVEAVQGAEVDTFESEKNKKGDLVPNFDFVTAQGLEKSTADLVKGKPVLLVLFNPSCGHCQTLLEQIRDNIALFENVNIVFLTGKPLQSVLPNYVVNVGVDKMEQINVASDNSDITLKIFEYYGIPQIMLYNKEHKLEFMYYKDATNKQMLQHLRK